MAKKKKSGPLKRVQVRQSSLFSKIFGRDSKKISKSKQNDDYEDEELEYTASGVSRETVLRSLGAVIILMGILIVFAIFKLGGPAGELLLRYSLVVFGYAGYLIWIPLLALGSYTFMMRAPKLQIHRVVGAVGILLTALAIPNLLSNLTSTKIGGLTGNLLAHNFNSLFSFYPSILFLTVLLFVSIGLAFNNIPTLSDIKELKDKIYLWIKNYSERRSLSKQDSLEDDEEIEEEEEEEYEEALDIRDELLEKTRKATKRDTAKSPNQEAINKGQVKTAPKEVPVRKENVPENRSYHQLSLETFVPPPLSLLQKDSGKASVGDTKANMATVKRTLGEFGIQVEMDEVSIGPTVTRYALKPAQGVKLSRIVNHRQELALALRAETIRIEAPIPGKSLVGIEIPNESKSTVGLGTLFAEPEWKASDKPLLIALGKGISGNTVFSNLARMPHVLIAGTTGSGKSVMVHSFIQSLIFRNSPSDLKLILVDPKKVELTLYNNIPHLYTPVITNAKVTIRTLNWAVNEMERRYDVLQEEGARDIASYHKEVYKKAIAKNPDAEKLPERMPYIVIIIDELADIMMSYPKELESAIVRLAQKSRAVGIHLILSTQRPSVNVITGLIKANIPSRIALKVASQIDSRTIIDTAGAEQLLGQGDLLFTSSENPKQERVQSAFVSDAEVKRVVDYLKHTYRDHVPEEINIDSNPGGDNGMQALFGTDLGSIGGGDTDDDLFEEAKEIVIAARKASTSYLQRRLKIGYSRAARLMDMLEERGVIGAGDGARPREVLVGAPNMESQNIDEDELLS